MGCYQSYEIDTTTLLHSTEDSTESISQKNGLYQCPRCHRYFMSKTSRDQEHFWCLTDDEVDDLIFENYD